MKKIFSLLFVSVFFLSAHAEESSKGVIDRILSYQNESQVSILHYAVMLEDKEAVELLLMAGIDVNDRIPRQDYEDEASPGSSEGYLPIDIAVEKGNSELTSLLLQYGADPYELRGIDFNKMDYYSENYSPIYTAIKEKNYEILEIFVEYGIDFSKDCYKNNTLAFPYYYSALEFGIRSNDRIILSIILGVDYK